MSDRPERTLSPEEERREIALRLAVELRRGEGGNVHSGYVTRTAQAFEAYLLNGTAER